MHGVLTSRLVRTSAALLALIALATPTSRAAQLDPKATPDEVAIYEAFRAWITRQPDDTRDGDAMAAYRRELQRQGKSDTEIGATIATLRAVGDRAEIERWNRILTAAKPAFNTAPNAFLVEMAKGLKPGRSLDVGMGQGRNTIYLAQQGWDSHGFDPADRAVAAAQADASRLGLTITTSVARAEEFAWGNDSWDLIVLSYVGARQYAEPVARALRPGGMVIVEGFHRDATKTLSIGGAVVFDTNELLTIFNGLRVVRYEDTPAVSDFGMTGTRVVRLAAVKP
jgi:SAM-dependent methyltransferase